MGVTRNIWKETKFCEGGKRDGGDINSDKLGRVKNGDNVDGGHEGVSRDNGME